MANIKNNIVYKHKKFPKIGKIHLAGSYYNKEGKIIYLKDVNGLNVDYTISSATFLLDKNNENHMLIDNWLQGHPEIINSWERTDLYEKEKQDTADTLDAAQHIIEAAKMNVKDVEDFSKLAGFNMNSNTEVLRAKIITMAQENGEKFSSIHFDPEKNYRVFIYDALKSKHLSYKNATFMYGKEAIGTNEEQVIVWLKDNKDIFALIKHEHRGGNEVKKVKVKKEKV